MTIFRVAMLLSFIIVSFAKFSYGSESVKTDKTVLIIQNILKTFSYYDGELDGIRPTIDNPNNKFVDSFLKFVRDYTDAKSRHPKLFPNSPDDGDLAVFKDVFLNCGVGDGSPERKENSRDKCRIFSDARTKRLSGYSTDEYIRNYTFSKDAIENVYSCINGNKHRNIVDIKEFFNKVTYLQKSLNSYEIINNLNTILSSINYSSSESLVDACKEYSVDDATKVFYYTSLYKVVINYN